MAQQRMGEACTRREPGLFVEKIPLNRQMQVIYCMVYHNAPGAREQSADADMDPAVVCEIQRNVRRIVSYYMIRANQLLQIGGEDMDCEADEICFRSKRVHVAEGNLLTEKVQWIRFLAVSRRGSSLIYLNDLEDRITAAGKGGGGKILECEVEHHFLREWQREFGRTPRPLLAPWSVLHTDGADAYRKLHRLSGSAAFRPWNYWHTWVRHGKKKDKRTGQILPVQFAARKRISLRDGAVAQADLGTHRFDFNSIPPKQ